MAAVTLNIGSSPEMKGSLKFVGANTYGPQLTMELLNVQIGPAAAMNMIGDAYGIIELEGQVLIDPVSSSFGTITGLDDTAVMPSSSNYYIGTGVMSWKGGAAPSYSVMGNCESCEFEQQVQRLDHWEHMTGIRSKDFSPVVQQAARVRLRLDEWTAENLKLYFLST
jgi:hypothetical protein